VKDTKGIQRFTHGRKCPVCQGSDNDPRGQGNRCHGFISGEWVHCSREEHAGRATYHLQSQTWSHKATGSCPCGVEHAPSLELPKPKFNRGVIEHIYKYRDADGKVVHETVRYKNPKQFLQRRPLGGNKYAWDLTGIEPVLYNLPAILAADDGEPVWIVEGEKDADRLGTEDLLATTNPMGAGKWRDSYSDYLRNRSCFIIADNDPPDPAHGFPEGRGMHHAKQVASSLQGKAAAVRIVCLPVGKDASDFLDAGNTIDQLRGWADAAPLWKPANGFTLSKNGNGNGNGRIDYSSLTDEELGLTLARDVKPANVNWLWEYHLARGEMSLIAGEGGLGKSMFLLACAAAVSRGAHWPDQKGAAPLGHVVIVSAEDNADTTLRPRLEALGADLSRITFCKARLTVNQGDDHLVHPMSLQDHSYWKAVLGRHPDTCLLIVDPIPSYLGRGVNDRQNAEIRAVLEPFIEDVIRPLSVAFYANTHLNKSLDTQTPTQRITGSIAYANIPRNVHIIVRDPDRPDQRYFKQCKANNAPDDLPAIAFSVKKTQIQFATETIETAIPEFNGGLHQIDLSSLMNAGRQKRGPTPVKSSRFAEWLWDQLKGGEPVKVTELVNRARDKSLLLSATDKNPKPSITPLYNARDRIPELHRGWTVKEDIIEVGYGPMKKDRKTWQLIEDDGTEDEDESDDCMESEKPAY
jgi:AAA domain